MRIRETAKTCMIRIVVDDENKDWSSLRTMCVIKARGRSSKITQSWGTRDAPPVDLYHFFGIPALIQERGFYYFMKAFGDEKKIHVPFEREKIREKERRRSSRRTLLSFEKVRYIKLHYEEAAVRFSYFANIPNWKSTTQIWQFTVVAFLRRAKSANLISAIIRLKLCHSERGRTVRVNLYSTTTHVYPRRIAHRTPEPSARVNSSSDAYSNLLSRLNVDD